jgi:hypothetical protein
MESTFLILKLFGKGGQECGVPGKHFTLQPLNDLMQCLSSVS